MANRQVAALDLLQEARQERVVEQVQAALPDQVLLEWEARQVRAMSEREERRGQLTLELAAPREQLMAERAQAERAHWARFLVISHLLWEQALLLEEQR